MNKHDKLRSDGKATLWRFSGLLSLEVSPEEAARRMGFNPVYGRALLSRLRKVMGAQAV